MSILDVTYRGAYKGIPFPVDRMSTTGGQKFVKHVFVNSNNQSIEKLGKKQRAYTLGIILSNNSEFDDYILFKNTVIDVLDSNEAGVLVHPLFGQLENIICVDWNLDEDFVDLGRGKITAVFEVDLPQSVPEVSSNTLSQVITLSSQLNEAIIDDFGENVSTSFTSNITNAIEQVRGAVTSLKDKTQVFAQIADKVDEFTNQLNELSADVVSLVQDPSALMTSINNVFQTVSGLYTSLDATFEVMTSFFDFGDDDIEMEPLTSSLIERSKNRELFNQSMQTLALSNAYVVASKIAFSTIREQQKISQILEAQYDKIFKGVTLINLKGNEETIGLNVDTKDDLTSQRIAVSLFFEDQRTTLRQIIDIFTNETSARLLSYQYFGTDALGEEIAQLNNERDSSFIGGNLEIVTR